MLRHAKAAQHEPADSGLDHDRPLARRGRRDAPAVGRWLADAGYVPDLVLCSTAQRTRETAELVLDAIAGPAGSGAGPVVRFDDGLYLASSAGLLDAVRAVSDDVATLMLVGHSPGIGHLAPLLADPGVHRRAAVPSSDLALLERVRVSFPTAAIAVVALRGRWRDAGPGTGRLVEVRVPRD